MPPTNVEAVRLDPRNMAESCGAGVGELHGKDGVQSEDGGEQGL